MNFFTNPEDGSPRWERIVVLFVVVFVAGFFLARAAMRSPKKQSQSFYNIDDQVWTQVPYIHYSNRSNTSGRNSRAGHRNKRGIPGFMQKTTSTNDSDAAADAAASELAKWVLADNNADAAASQLGKWVQADNNADAAARELAKYV